MAKRIFTYEGKDYDDPDAGMTPDQVRQTMSAFFPELSNAEVKETKRGDDAVFTFARRVGTKG